MVIEFHVCEPRDSGIAVTIHVTIAQNMVSRSLVAVDLVVSRTIVETHEVGWSLLDLPDVGWREDALGLWLHTEVLCRLEQFGVSAVSVVEELWRVELFRMGVATNRQYRNFLFRGWHGWHG